MSVSSENPCKSGLGDLKPRFPENFVIFIKYHFTKLYRINFKLNLPKRINLN